MKFLSLAVITMLIIFSIYIGAFKYELISPYFANSIVFVVIIIALIVRKKILK